MTANQGRRILRGGAPPVGPSVTALDHFGPHNLVEWVIWIVVLIVVLVVVWRVINRGLPPD